MSALTDKLQQIRGGKILNIQIERRIKSNSDGITGAGFYHWQCEEFWLHVELPNGEVVGIGVESGQREGRGRAVLYGSVGEIDDPESLSRLFFPVLHENRKKGAE